MARILLGVTGSVAALKTPELHQTLVRANHAVRVVATQAALYFFRREQLPPGVLYTDADEWPRRGFADIYQREDPVLHIELRRWAEVLLVAPLDANTLAKLAHGLADNCLTCVFRAWDLSKPVLLAPAMNTLMWDHPATRRHLLLLLEYFAGPSLSASPGLGVDELVDFINLQPLSLKVLGPISKRLACGDVGAGAMQEVGAIADAVTPFLVELESQRQ